jgi:uncharacterized protein YneF (UPF0154 family)
MLAFIFIYVDINKEINNMNKILWTTPKILKKAIKKIYLNYYGNNISDECIKQILIELRELESEA